MVSGEKPRAEGGHRREETLPLDVELCGKQGCNGTLGALTLKADCWVLHIPALLLTTQMTLDKFLTLSVSHFSHL